MSNFVMTRHAMSESMLQRDIPPTQVDDALRSLESKAQYVTRMCKAETYNGLTLVLAPHKFIPNKVAVVTLWVTGRHIG